MAVGFLHPVGLAAASCQIIPSRRGLVGLLRERSSATSGSAWQSVYMCRWVLTRRRRGWPRDGYIENPLSPHRCERLLGLPASPSPISKYSITTCHYPRIARPQQLLPTNLDLPFISPDTPNPSANILILPDRSSCLPLTSPRALPSPHRNTTHITACITTIVCDCHGKEQDGRRRCRADPPRTR